MVNLPCTGARGVVHGPRALGCFSLELSLVMLHLGQMSPLLVRDLVGWVGTWRIPTGPLLMAVPARGC